MSNFKKIGTEIHTYSDQEIYKLHAELRKKVWPNYYDAIGEEFLRKLDSQVASMKP